MTDFDKFFIPSGNCRLDAQLKFTAEIDKMTSVYRKTLLIDRSRAENDAEHSWHIAVMALLFEEYAVEKVNLHHAIEMLIVHDLIEIYAGDTFAYDVEGNKTKAAREEAAAEKLFSSLLNRGHISGPCGRSSMPVQRPTHVMPTVWTNCSPFFTTS